MLRRGHEDRGFFETPEGYWEDRLRTGRHIVIVEDPHISSLAALVLLLRGYKMAEVAKWLKFREDVLDKFEKKHGKVFCEYCGRDDLVREMPEGVKKSARLVTIDHVVPLSKGGGKYDRDNLKIACFTCNQKKGDSMPEVISADR